MSNRGKPSKRSVGANLHEAPPAARAMLLARATTKSCLLSRKFLYPLSQTLEVRFREPAPSRTDPSATLPSAKPGFADLPLTQPGLADRSMADLGLAE